jgi:membrane protein required for colicin V production
LLLWALIKGYRRGFVIAIFSFLAIFIGLAAAMKFSVVVSAWLASHTNIGLQWLPILAFVIVMIGVGFIVRFFALIIEKSLQLMMLGFINRLAGIVLYAILFTILLSIILFYVTKMELLKPETIAESRFYTFIKPWGPKAVEIFATIIPWFKDMFKELTDFFEGVANKATTP